jgi:AAA domain-containing protein
MLAVEQALVNSALSRQEEGAAVVPEQVLADSLRSSLQRLPTLGADQLEMAARLASSGAGVECVEAAPGTGKTTALGVYVAACRRAGVPVIGCAPSARPRDELRLGARIDACFTVDRLLLERQRCYQLLLSVILMGMRSTTQAPAASSLSTSTTWALTATCTSFGGSTPGRTTT